MTQSFHINHLKAMAVAAVILLGLTQGSSAGKCIKPSVLLTIYVPNYQTLPKADRDVSGTIKITNLSDHFVAFAMGKGWPGPNFRTKVKVWSNEGRLIELTPLGNFLFRNGKAVSIRLGDDGGGLLPGESTDRPFLIDVFYTFLYPGSYSIQVTEPDPENDTCSISSNVAQFKLIK